MENIKYVLAALCASRTGQIIGGIACLVGMCALGFLMMFL